MKKFKKYYFSHLDSSFTTSQTLSNATELSSPARGMAGVEQNQSGSGASSSGNNAPRKKGLELAQICGGVKAVKIAVAKHDVSIFSVF